MWSLARAVSESQNCWGAGGAIVHTGGTLQLVSRGFPCVGCGTFKRDDVIMFINRHFGKAMEKGDLSATEAGSVLYETNEILARADDKSNFLQVGSTLDDTNCDEFVFDAYVVTIRT
ncbi:hypothetical protein NDU88_012102 [Pleurodeles waltl]|uniref:Uncharacterized protein n=1 Tax=Pleurodeles waltl TaxID=8319 RepID=A0AAV7R501_PLEWA|nr:hypothetical protein NDU88_012102 [Pleurodeles waltl]